MRDTLVVIPCKNRKLTNAIKEERLRALEIYTGNAFLWGTRYADVFDVDWAVFDPDIGFVLQYDIMSLSSYEIEQKKPFAIEDLLEQIQSKNLCDYNTVIVLGADIYFSIIKELFSKSKVVAPFNELRAREYINALKNATIEELNMSIDRSYGPNGPTGYEYVENEKFRFTWSYWKLPSKENAFSGWLEGPPPTKEQIEWVHFKIDYELDFWKGDGPKPGAWGQFHATTSFIGKKLNIQLWDSIMWLCEEEGPTPFEGYCSGLNLAQDEDGFLQCYMHLKDVSCPAADYEWTPNWCMQESADGGYLLNLGRIYELSEIK